MLTDNLLKSTTSKNDYSNFILRKSKCFNKSRYSRNRQYYRTGVYWCLWLNIILVLGLYYSFYRFSFKFNYIAFIYLFAALAAFILFFSKNYYIGAILNLKYILEIIAHSSVLQILILVTTLNSIAAKIGNLCTSYNI